MKRKLSILISILVVAVFAGYSYRHIQEFKPLLEINPAYLLALFGCNLGVLAANALFIQLTLLPYEKFIKFKESLFLSTLSSVGNFFAPAGGGFGLRAIYLKQRHDLSYSDFVSTLSGNYILVFLVNSFCALGAMFFLRQHSAQTAYPILIILFSGLFLTSLALTLFRVPAGLFRPLGKLGKKIELVVDGWHKISANRFLVVRLLGLILLNLLISVLNFWLIIHALNLHVGVAALLFFSVLGSLSLFVNITPGNIGIKEAIYLFSSAVIGFSTSQILQIALVDRGVVFITLLLLWAITARYQKSALVKP